MQGIIPLLQKFFATKFIWHAGYEPKIIAGIDTGERNFFYVQKGSEKLKFFHDRLEVYRIDNRGVSKVTDTITKEEVDILYEIFNNPDNFKRI